VGYKPGNDGIFFMSAADLAKNSNSVCSGLSESNTHARSDPSCRQRPPCRMRRPRRHPDHELWPSVIDKRVPRHGPPGGARDYESTMAGHRWRAPVYCAATVRHVCVCARARECGSMSHSILRRAEPRLCSQCRLACGASNNTELEIAFVFRII
jgi:hypothetical protein